MSNLKKARQAAGLSQSKLAELSGVAVRLIQSYEQGERDINGAAVITVIKLAKALQVNVEDLIEQ